MQFKLLKNIQLRNSSRKIPNMVIFKIKSLVFTKDHPFVEEYFDARTIKSFSNAIELYNKISELNMVISQSAMLKTST